MALTDFYLFGLWAEFSTWVPVPVATFAGHTLPVNGMACVSGTGHGSSYMGHLICQEHERNDRMNEVFFTLSFLGCGMTLVSVSSDFSFRISCLL